MNLWKKFLQWCLVLTILPSSVAETAFAQFQPGEIFVAGWNIRIFRVDPSSFAVSLFADSADGLSGVSALEFTPDGTRLLASNFTTSQVLSFDAAGNGTVLLDSSHGLNGPFGENGLAFDAAGNLYVANFRSSQILRFPAGGGPGIVFADASDGVLHPDGLAFAANGDLLVANRDALNVLRIDPAGNASVFDTFALSDGNPFSIDIRGNGDIYVATLGGRVFRYPGGVAASRTLLTTIPSVANPALKLSLDESILYYTSFGTGDLHVIDPDTGSSTQVIPPGGVPGGVSIAVFDPGVLEVRIDIKPGSFPNPINRKSSGNVPVALLGSASFGATGVDRSTVRFAGASPLNIGGGPEDVNGDGFLDVVFHFATQRLALPDGTTKVCMTGKTSGGNAFRGCDAVHLIR